MPPKKYHAIIFIGILVMLLLLGLHLLGIGYSAGGQTAAASAAASAARTANLAKNSSQTSSSASNTAQVYRHPIVYDKLTGATNNQINDVLGAKQPASDYPIDHYQQQAPANQLQHQFNQLPHQDDFFTNMHRQTPGGFPPPPLGAHPLAHHMRPPPMGPPMMSPHMMTTMPPMSQQQQQQQRLDMRLPPLPPPTPPAPSSPNNQRQPVDGQQVASADSLPSASSLNNNGARPSNNSQPLQLQQQQQQQQQQMQPQYNQQPIYYTPPIFAYNNLDQNRPLSNPQSNGALYGFPPQQTHTQAQAQQQQLPPIGVPEVPMSIDEYNERQAQLRGLSNQQQLNRDPNFNEITQQSDRYGGKQSPSRANAALVEPQFSTGQQPDKQQQQQQNLLADPQQQQRHKQQMLDRQLLFGNALYGNPENNLNVNQTSYYPDPALYRQQQQQQQAGLGSQQGIRPPYAHNMLLTPALQTNDPNAIGMQYNNLKPTSAQNRILPLNNQRLDPNHLQQHQQQQQQQLADLPVGVPKLVSPSDQPRKQLVKSNNGPPAQMNQQLSAASQLQQAAATNSLPICVRQQAANEIATRHLELANSSSQMPTLFCNEDPEYPTKEIMRALELYAADRSIEQLLPQLLIQIHLAQRTDNANRNTLLGDIQHQQLTLDSLQPTIGGLAGNKLTDLSQAQAQQPIPLDEQRSTQQQQQQPVSLFPSANYESMCRATNYMAQPRRAKNLLGQWKVVVNLPGHKYRGIAISQMIRVEECTRPNSECSVPTASSGPVNGGGATTGNLRPIGGLVPLAKSRCLQHYENQRLVAWSHQQGLHMDIFRVPIACSCHIRR